MVCARGEMRKVPPTGAGRSPADCQIAWKRHAPDKHCPGAEMFALREQVGKHAAHRQTAARLNGCSPHSTSAVTPTAPASANAARRGLRSTPEGALPVAGSWPGGKTLRIRVATFVGAMPASALRGRAQGGSRVAQGRVERVELAADGLCLCLQEIGDRSAPHVRQA